MQAARLQGCCEYKQSSGNQDPGKDGVYHLIQQPPVSSLGHCINNCLYHRLGDTGNTVYCFAPSHIGQASCVEDGTNLAPSIGASMAATTGASLAPTTGAECPRHKLGPAECEGLPDHTYFADPTACGRFYQCDRGEAVLKECQAGLLWNDWDGKKICDWPGNVDCCKGTGRS